MTSQLQMTGVRKVYGAEQRGTEHVAFDDLSLDVSASEFLAIVGPSGCGKSTLLRIAAGLIEASAGRVALDGELVTGPPDGVVYLFQQYAKSLFPWRTVLRNVTFALEGRSMNRQDRVRRATELLGQVGLAGFEHRYPWQMSGGMQQRVAIARALAAEPSLLLLDEPFSAVDALTRVELQTLILNLWSVNRFTAILVTHDVEEAIFLADRIAVLSPPPTTVAELIDVGLQRPRDAILTRESKRFITLRHQLMTMLLGRSKAADA